MEIKYERAPTVNPVTVVSNAIVRDCARVAISPVPKAASQGPNGISVPKRPRLGPTRTKISVLLVFLINLVSLAEINSLAKAFLASGQIS